MKAPLPCNESERLADLKECAILDTPPEPDYDDLTKLAAHICGVPIALVSLVDSDRQWFKSKVGITASQTPRDQAFCAHAILDPGLLIVSDATADTRFSDNPLVVGDPKIRFYAGAPLVTPRGHGLGTLCAIDREPRHLDVDQTESLRILARQVVTQIELRRTAQKHREACEMSDNLLLRVLPSAIANRLKQGEQQIADFYPSATVIVAEVVDFSAVTAELTPLKQIDVLSQLFRSFDHLVGEKGLQKLKAMGIKYYAVGGVPIEHQDSVSVAAEVALGMQTAALDMKIEGVGPFSLRIGISHGPVVAGIINTCLLGYDLWGRTISAAQAMEASAPPGSIQITQDVYERISDDFLVESRGVYYVADLGDVACYLLKGIVPKSHRK